MEAFIPWGIRSAFRRGESPRITELTVTSGLYREISIIPFHHRDIFGCSSCGVAFCRTKGCKLFLLLDRYFVFISCVFKIQMYSFSSLGRKYMKRYVGINVTHKLRNIAFLFFYLGGDNSRGWVCSLVYCDEHSWGQLMCCLFIWISVYRAQWTGKYLRWRTRYATILWWIHACEKPSAFSPG